MLLNDGRAIRTSSDAMRLFSTSLGGARKEVLQVAHLDGERRVLFITSRTNHCHAMVDLPIRAIVREAISIGSRAILIAHNHPSGNAMPSEGDKAATRLLAETVRGLDVQLVDHLIFADKMCRSFRALGLL